MHTLLGLYMWVFFCCVEPDISWFWLAYSWEWVVSLNFDWQYISGKKKFRWPLVCTKTFLVLQCLVHICTVLLFLEPILPVVRFDRNVSLEMRVFHSTILILSSSATALNVTTWVVWPAAIQFLLLTRSLAKSIVKDCILSTRYQYMPFVLPTKAHTFDQCFGNAAIGLASINLSLRTYV